MPAAPLPHGVEEYMVHRVMQRVDVALEQRLRDAIATVVQEQTRSVLPRLREEIESVVRNAVYEAVAEELQSGSPKTSGR
jgi:flagellar biosynthesis/type III secretory pathway protein FliH